MLHSILITGGLASERLVRAQKQAQTDLQPCPDTLILQPDPSIKIKAIRQLETFLSRKPYQRDQKIAVITQADKLTLPAQHALLKTLEEPPAHSLIILLADSDSQVLPTIVSRCHLIPLTTSQTLTSQQLKTQQQLFDQITQVSLGQRINLAAHLAKSKTEALDFCRQQTLFLRQKMLQQPNLAVQKTIRHLLQTINYLQANLNPKLCLENLFFLYKKP